MPAKVDINSCTGCGTCIDECPAAAISLEESVAAVDESSCLECGVCEDACPNGAIKVE